MADNYSLNLDLGFKTITVKFPDVDEETTIRFNPSDMKMGDRLIEASKEIQKEAERYETMEINEDDPEEVKAIMDGLNQKFCDLMDYAFGTKISDEIFKYCAPLAIVNGDYYIFMFIEKITPVIKKIQADDMKAADKKADKYLKKYQKVTKK